MRDTARLSRRYPSIARYGVFGVSTWPIGCDTPSPFSQRFPLGEHAKWRCDTPPPPQMGYLSDTRAIPYENKANGCDTPSAIPSRKRVLRDMGGGVSLALGLRKFVALFRIFRHSGRGALLLDSGAPGTTDKRHFLPRPSYETKNRRESKNGSIQKRSPRGPLLRGGSGGPLGD